MLDLAANRKRKEPMPQDDADLSECQLCGKEASAMQAGVRLCRRCNNSAPGAALGRELEGFLLATRCMSLLGGEAWMRAMMLNKVRWRKWRRALRTEDRTGGAEGWWWRLLESSIPEEERAAVQTANGKILSAEDWGAWWDGELRGTQGLSLLQEFYEEQPSACRTLWHR